MNERIGLSWWEVRAVRNSIVASAISMCLAILLAGPVLGAHWLLLAWAVGGVLGWAALSADRASRARGGQGSRLRRVLGRICEWELRVAAIVAMIYASFLVLMEIMSMPGMLSLLETLPDGETTKAEVIAAMKVAIEDACRQVREKAGVEIALVGISGIAGALLSGLTDWLVLGAVGARHGVSPWRLVGFGRVRQDLRKYGVRERARRRCLLGGEAPE